MTQNEYRRIERRIKKAERRLSRGVDERVERDGVRSEHAIIDNLQTRLRRRE